MNATPQKQLAEQIRRYANDFMAFAADIYVPMRGSFGRLGDHWADFQRRDFEAMAPTLEAMVGGEQPKIRRFVRERTKGASKDADATIVLLYLMFFCPRAMKFESGAKDELQAGEWKLLAKAILAFDGGAVNRLLASKIEVQKKRVIAHADTPGRSESVCEILSSDEGGAHGSRPDGCWINELSHGISEGYTLTLLDNSDKTGAFVLLSLNAGECGSWVEKLIDLCESMPDRWHVSRVKHPSPWISDADLAESRLRNPPQRFNRLWFGVWSSGEGDGLDMAKVERAVVLPGPARRSPSKIFLIGCDLAKKRDHAALVTVAVDPMQQVVELADVQSWAPQDFPSGEIALSVVESAALELRERYNALALWFDPWQCHYLAERLQQQGLLTFEVPFVSATRDAMASALVDAFNNDQLKLYRDPALLRDLSRIRIKEASHGGLRLDAVRDADGHADRAIALSIVLPHALEVANSGLSFTNHSGNDAAEILTPV